MSIQISFDASARRIFVFELIYQARAAQEQADKKKLSAFGALARLNPVNRPKPETVVLSKVELRYEPFWHVVAQRSVDYRCQVEYVVPIANEYAQRVDIAGLATDVTKRGKKRHLTVPGVESCFRKIDFEMRLDGLKREVRDTALAKYSIYRAHDVEAMTEPAAVVPLVPAASVIQIATSTLTGNAIIAHEIDLDVLLVEKLHLYWRPVWAFEFLWTAAGKTGVIEVDGLNGESQENGRWFKDKLERVFTREMLVEASSDVASALVPGSGVAIKVIDKLI